MSLRDPLAKARGWGSAKDGVGHWWAQRLTAVALLLLSPWFVLLALGLIGADQLTVRHTLAQPLNASLLIAFVLSLFWHARLGLQVVIEDYVHEDGTKFGVIALLNLAIIAGAAFALFCVVRLALGGA